MNMRTKAIAALYSHSDLTIAQIAHLLNVPVSTVGSAAQRLQKRGDLKSRYRLSTTDYVAKLSTKGMRAQDIARRMNLNIRTVYNYISKLNA